jgi:proteasome lid subunit RPN8/RPN11
MSDSQPSPKRIIFGPKTTEGSTAASAAAMPAPLASMRFPDFRSVLWQPVSAVGAPPSDVPFFVTQEILFATNRHVGEDKRTELGGFLLGTRYRCPDSGREFVVIDQYSPAQYTESNLVSLAFTKEAWSILDEELSGKFQGKLLVGWYHSHPGHDIFLSESDRPIHEQRFPNLWMSALVIDPIQNFGGFFARRGGVLDCKVPVEFFELLPGPPASKVETCMPWTGYTAKNPVTGEAVRTVRAAGAAPPPAIPSAPAGNPSPLPATRPDAAEDSPVTMMPFPDRRCYHWIPREGGDTPEPDVAILVSQEVMQRVNRLVGVTLEREIGGFLLGNRYRCPNSQREYVIIDQYSAAQFTESTGVSLAFTKEAWAQMDDELSGKFRGKKLVGWYHSHPNMGIFLSRWDVELHDGRFPADWMSALVIEPGKHDAGFFARRGGRLDPRTPVSFYEYLDSGDIDSQYSAMPWTGHICRDPRTNQIIVPRKMAAADGAITQPMTPMPAQKPAQQIPKWAMAAVAGVVLLGGGAYFATRSGGETSSAASKKTDSSVPGTPETPPHFEPQLGVSETTVINPPSPHPTKKKDKNVAADQKKTLKMLVQVANLPNPPADVLVKVAGEQAEVIRQSRPDTGFDMTLQVSDSGPVVQSLLNDIAKPGASVPLNLALFDRQKPDKPLIVYQHRLTHDMWSGNVVKEVVPPSKKDPAGTKPASTNTDTQPPKPANYIDPGTGGTGNAGAPPATGNPPANPVISMNNPEHAPPPAPYNPPANQPPQNNAGPGRPGTGATPPANGANTGQPQQQANNAVNSSPRPGVNNPRPDNPPPPPDKPPARIADASGKTTTPAANPGGKAEVKAALLTLTPKDRLQIVKLANDALKGADKCLDERTVFPRCKGDISGPPQKLVEFLHSRNITVFKRLEERLHPDGFDAVRLLKSELNAIVIDVAEANR